MQARWELRDFSICSSIQIGTLTTEQAETRQRESCPVFLAQVFAWVCEMQLHRGFLGRQDKAVLSTVLLEWGETSA